jgi:hypothetical protein
VVDFFCVHFFCWILFLLLHLLGTEVNSWC